MIFTKKLVRSQSLLIDFRIKSRSVRFASNLKEKTEELQESSEVVQKRQSTVFLGTLYENIVISTINLLGAKLTRIGGANDHGIDFQGPIQLPHKAQFHIVGQAKNYLKSKIGPSVVREWEGVMARQDFRDVLGVLACPNGYSKSAISATMSSRFPIVLFTIRFNSEISKQFLPQDLDRSNITGIGLEGGTQMNDGGVVALQGFGTKTSELDSIPDTALRGLISGMLWNTAANRFLGDLIATKKFTKSNNDGTIVETLSILSNGVCIY